MTTKRSPDGPDHRQRLGFLLARVGRNSWDAFESALAPLDLRPRHVVVLMEVRNAGGMSQGALLKALAFDPAVLVGLLNTLERQSLIARTRDPLDRRRHTVQLTATGEQTLDRAEKALAMAEEQVLGILGRRERETLQRTLAKIAAAHPPTPGR